MIVKLNKKYLFDPPGSGCIGDHYFHTGCPYVRDNKQKYATALKQNTLQHYMGPGGSLWSLLTCCHCFTGKQTLLEALAERESIYRLLNQTTPENTSKDFASYTVDPNTRYPTLNKKLVLPYQVTNLIDTDNPNLVREWIALELDL